MAISTIYWTYAMLKTKIENDTDIEVGDGVEAFINNEEFLGLVNEAIDRAEQTVHTLYEDYFLTRAVLPIVSGTEEYALPDSIYAHKIRRIVYRNGSAVAEVPRVRDWHKFEKYEVSKTSSSGGNLYNYFLLNSVPGAPRLLVTPTPTESGNLFQIWFIRGANRLVLDTDVLDIPEAQNFIMAYIRMKIYEKEINPNLQKAASDVEMEKRQLEDTLTAMIPDANNEIEADYSAYGEHI
jgi:hypothetical protein